MISFSQIFIIKLIKLILKKIIIYLLLNAYFITKSQYLSVYSLKSVLDFNNKKSIRISTGVCYSSYDQGKAGVLFVQNVRKSNGLLSWAVTLKFMLSKFTVVVDTWLIRTR